MSSIFSKIVQGDIPSYKVAENESFLAFLDIRPLTKGHTLVIPKLEVDYFFDLDDDTLSKLMIFASKVSAGIRSHTKCLRVGVAVIGFEVPHAHVHLIPINHIDDMNFANPKLNLSSEEFSSIAQGISSRITL